MLVLNFHFSLKKITIWTSTHFQNLDGFKNSLFSASIINCEKELASIFVKWVIAKFEIARKRNPNVFDVFNDVLFRVEPKSKFGICSIPWQGLSVLNILKYQFGIPDVSNFITNHIIPSFRPIFRSFLKGIF